MTSARPNRLRPLVAARALRTLIGDPERTEQVFIIVRALAGNALVRSFRRFERTPTGRAVLDERRDLLVTLQDREALRRLPPGSLGRTYLDFVEAEHLSADGLVEASQAEEAGYTSEDFARFGMRMRDMHDLWHVVTGYGRDTFGEDCLLAFTFAQTVNPGVGVIAAIGALKIARERDRSVFGAVRRAYRAGRRAAWLPAQDWEALLAQPLNTVRASLGIEPPVRYQHVRARWAAGAAQA